MDLVTKHRLGRFVTRAVVPLGVAGYMLWRMRPQEPAFVRYVNERSSFESKFAELAKRTSIRFEQRTFCSKGELVSLEENGADGKPKVERRFVGLLSYIWKEVAV
jgi:hypothetical protein